MNNSVKYSILLFAMLAPLHCFPALADADRQEAPAAAAAAQTESDQTNTLLEEETEAAKEVARLLEIVPLPSRQRSMSNQEIIKELIKLGKPAVPSLITEMEKADSNTMAVVMYSLGAIGDPRAIVPLYNLLPSVEEESEPPGTNTKASICFTLAMIGDLNSIPLIMQGPYAANRIIGGAITYIGAIATMLGSQSVDPLIDVITRYKDDKKIYGAVAALGKVADERAIPFLKTLLEHPDNMVKRLAIDSLAQIGDPSTSEWIRPFLESTDDLVRETAAESMYYLRDTKAVQKLSSLALEDPVSQVRLKAILSLGAYADKEAFNVSSKATEDIDVIVRAMATEWLGKSNNKKAEPFIKKRIKDIDGRVALRAVTAYEKLLGKEAEHHLISVLDDDRWIVQREAIRSLTQIGSTKASSPIASILKDAIEVEDKSVDARNIVFETLLALSEIGDAKTMEIIKNLSAKATDPEIKQYFDGALHDLYLKLRNGNDVRKWIKVLEGENIGERAVAIDVLGKLGERAATKALIEQFGKTDIDVSSSIPKALGRIRDPSALPFLEDLLTNELYDDEKVYPARANAAWAIGQLQRASSLQALKECIAKYEGEPLSAIVAIAKIAGKDAIPQLYEIKEQLMRSPSPERMKQYDNINWLIRNLKNGWSISALDTEP